MKRLFCFVIAMGLSTSAYAGSFSFVVAGHTIRIGAPRHCYSTSCVSVSIPGLVASRRRHGDVAAAQDTPAEKPVTPAAPSAAAAPVRAAPIIAPPISPPPSAPTLAAAETRAVPAPPAPAEPAKSAATETAVAARATSKPPVVRPSVEEPFAEQPKAQTQGVAMKSTSAVKAAPAMQSEPDNSPIGDWQTEGKTGQVRIEACGNALCGYLINASSHQKAEAILINMKPKRDNEWRGSIFSRASGNTYNAAMMLKSTNLLRVEACALGPFFCSANDWTRIMKTPAELITSRENANEPPS
jgi:uncharacterized protein (DUF2147 family)